MKKKKYRCTECEDEFEKLPTCENCGNEIEVGEMICNSLSHSHYCSADCFIEAEADVGELEEIEDED